MANQVSVMDVARYVLDHKGTMTTMKLQKLAYYCQAWGLVWDEAPLFKERIEAWANGPACPDLYAAHRGKYEVAAIDIDGQPNKLDQDAKETVDAVLEFYGDKPAQWLIDLTHREDPWIKARKGLAPGERGCNVIEHATMAEYYSRISADRVGPSF